MAHCLVAGPVLSHRRQKVSRHASRALGEVFALVLFVGFLGAAIPAGATMYKWVDDKGQTIYSDQPPPPSVKSEIVKAPPPPANPNALKEMINADTEMKLREKQKIEKAKEAEKARADTQKKQELCAAAQDRIQVLQRGDLYRVLPDGGRVFLDAETRRKETEEAQKAVRERCA
jgi:hypothetical protein